MTRRIVIVTGASSGIGAATTIRLADSGDTVIGVARSSESLDRVAQGHPRIQPYPLDILDREGMSGLITSVVSKHGRIDAVIHAAQVMAYGRVEDIPADVFERVVDTAIHGTANLARELIPQFRRQRAGTLVIINSLLGEIATPKMGAYDVGKWGQLGLARVLRLEVRDEPGIHVCTVAPGAINTPIYDQAANYAGRGGYPPPPVISPERVAAKAVRLLDHPRRHVNAGPVNTLTLLGFRVAPVIYERIVGPMVDRFVFAGEPSADNAGNVLAPQARGDARHGRWSLLGKVASSTPKRP